MKQACAAVGQGRLMALYSDAFQAEDIITAQILLTEEDFSNRNRYLNLRSTIGELIRLKVLPIINENDCVSTAEIEAAKDFEFMKVNFGGQRQAFRACRQQSGSRLARHFDRRRRALHR